jgi:hypothetical protein
MDRVSRRGREVSGVNGSTFKDRVMGGEAAV